MAVIANIVAFKDCKNVSIRIGQNNPPMELYTPAASGGAPRLTGNVVPTSGCIPLTMIMGHGDPYGKLNSATTAGS